jgi:RNA polymerase sigma factor (sigma-70 family)
LAAVKPGHVSADDISGYVNVNLPRLERFIQRELDYRESQGRLEPGQVAVEDVVAEAIGNALSEQQDSPEPMHVEPWVHRLARQAIDRLALENREDGHVPLEGSRGEQNVRATDEAKLQFHQPDEQLSEEDVIPDRSANSPEELAARDELIRLVETTLRGGGRDEAEAFILYAIEGFTAEEIADITSRTVEEVRASIRTGREHLQRALPIRDALKERLLEHSRSA